MIFSLSTVPGILLDLFHDFAIEIGILLGAILGLLAAFLGLRWGLWRFFNHTSLGSSMKNIPFVPQLDRWSFRSSKQFKRMVADSN